FSVVSNGSLSGYINASGESVTDLEYQYAYDFSEGRAKVATMGSMFLVFGFIDENGEYAVRPNYTEAKNFSEGFAAVKNTYEMWGYVDKDGKNVLPFEYDMAYDFSDGIARVQIGEKYGFIKKTEG
ncbi:MAG: WG repeat-containing protein, partial [Clostridia bacterium]|nr:WG repeat-containing protein [Clostridia bacterium]